MTMRTVNFDNLGPEELADLVGKPVTVMVYNRSDDSFYMSLSGAVTNIMISEATIRVETRGVSAPAWINIESPGRYATVTSRFDNGADTE